MGATSGQYWRWMGAFIEMHDRLRHIGKPTIARINGICVGGGNELQMACDLSVLVDDAYIRHVGPEHGSVPAGGATQWLPLIVGDRRAREIVMLCEPIAPAHGARVGAGVARRAARPSWTPAVAELADNLARKLPEAMRYTKTQLNWWRDLVWSQTVRARPRLAGGPLRADETREAVAAFHDKRKPRFAELRRLEAGEGRTCPSCGAAACRRHTVLRGVRRRAARRLGGPRDARSSDLRRESRTVHEVCIDVSNLARGSQRMADAAAAMNDEQLVLVERQPEQRTALVRLNRPKQLNALNGAVMDALCAALEELDRDDDVRAIVVTGNERAFAAGADIGEMAGATPIEMLLTNRIGQWDRIRKVTQAGDRRGQRLGARRRLRAGDDARPDRGGRGREVRPAGDQHRRHPRRRRDAAPDARDRQERGRCA